MQRIGIESLRDRTFWLYWIGRNCGIFSVASIVSIIVNSVFWLVAHFSIPGQLLGKLPQPWWMLIDVLIGVVAGTIGGLLIGSMQHTLLWQARVPRQQWMLATALGGALTWPLIWSFILNWMLSLSKASLGLGIGRYGELIFQLIFVGLLMLVGAIGGMIVGGLQGLVLQRQNLNRFAWVVAMFLSGALVVAGFYAILAVFATLFLGGGGD